MTITNKDLYAAFCGVEDEETSVVTDVLQMAFFALLWALVEAPIALWFIGII